MTVMLMAMTERSYLTFVEHGCSRALIKVMALYTARSPTGFSE